MAARLIGRVSRLDPRGFGFIETDAQPLTKDNVEWFFHARSVEDFDALTVGMTVSFLPKRNNPRGPRALVVRIEEDA